VPVLLTTQRAQMLFLDARQLSLSLLVQKTAASKIRLPVPQRRTLNGLPIELEALPLISMALRVDVCGATDLCNGGMRKLVVLLGPDSEI
jgi:hypothetical protein